MPEINSVVSSLVLNLVNIVVLFVILRILVYKPVKKFMTERRERVESEMAEAKKTLKEADEAKKGAKQSFPQPRKLPKKSAAASLMPPKAELPR